MTYTADGDIVLTPQRAILDASNNTVVLTLAAPGSALLGKIIAAVAVNVSNTASIAYSDPSGAQVHTFTNAGEAVWFYGATEYVWLLLSQGSSPSGQTFLDGIFGDGSDGDSTISSNTTLSGSYVKYFGSLTINSSIALDCGDRLICVNNSLTLNTNSSIHANGNAASGPAEGSARVPAFYGGGSRGGTGGFGEQGDQGASLSDAVGGAGGAGGDGSIANGGSGGTLTIADYVPRLIAQLSIGGGFPAGGTGGGGGGSDDFPQAGGGGGGAGVCVVAASTIVLNTGSKLLANGGAGGNVGAGGSDPAGGGGGGGGGFAVIIYENAEDGGGSPLSEAQVATYLEASGGVGATGSFSGTTGNNGATGRVLVIRVGSGA